ncbi:hypothetical protein [Paenibacillus sp. HB172176]|uniref:hypothetical protein n=1 Tax=Paenibacillus sp. HB172176 TaxID=2493690 RepID=UPI00143920A5|nr:hypothetical protein [Paenibacillus sp. HB172176]
MPKNSADPKGSRANNKADKKHTIESEARNLSCDKSGDYPASLNGISKEEG